MPITNASLLLGVFAMAFCVGIALDYRFNTSLDAFFHDAAIVQTERQSWQHVAIVALDPGVPGFISRRQALPLYSLAAKRVIEMGATAVFLDAVLYEYDHRTSYSVCVEQYQAFPNPHQYRWRESSQLIPFGNLSAQQFDKLFIAKPQFAAEDDFITVNLLQAFFGEALMPVDYFELENNTRLLDRLVADASIHKRTDGLFNTSFRWMNSSPNAVTSKTVSLHRQALGLKTPSYTQTEACNGVACQRVRFSHPKPNFVDQPNLPVIPVSELAGCTSSQHNTQYADIFKDRVVILQLTDPAEATDIKVTPMISALGSPREFLSGPQFLADAVETAVLGDSPRRPALWQRWLLLALCCMLSVYVAAFAKTGLGFVGPIVSLLMAWSLCFVTPPAQLWPVAAVFVSATTSLLLVIAIHISMGTAKAKLMAQYIPPQIRRLLLKYKGDKKFIHKHIDAVILMSDIAKYSNVTSELKDPAYVFQLLNHYFEETTLATQQKYEGWLESYVGDMVCFYWPVHEDTSLEDQQKMALKGAIDMARTQQRFFKQLAEDQSLDIPKDTLAKVSTFIGAGIGLTSGRVMMGNLGPQNGIQKFGCLGDPLNLASRTESLTRHFNTEILITEELRDSATGLGFKTRICACVVVKGRNTPVTLYALGEASDPRFSDVNIQSWETWYQGFVTEKNPTWPDSLSIFNKDKRTIETWKQESLWDEQLHSFILQQK